MNGTVPGGFPELEELEQLIERLGSRARVEVLTRVEEDLPVYGIALGTTDRSRPTLAVVGGVHGLERIGSRVVLSWLHTLTELLPWDGMLAHALEATRVVLVPLVNPWGVLHRRRSNPRGVDLMRNAPPHPDARGSLLIGGQRLSPRLPYYMGQTSSMEDESRALCAYIEREVFQTDMAVAIDVHSGFGLQDRLWFPYARTRKPFPHIAETFALKQLLDQSLPNHVYKMEPQAQSYTAQGDLWDHLHDVYREERPEGVFLPLTLEMGSWMWVKKNPRQLFDLLGGFNPLVPHRLRRTLRRHLMLFELMLRAVAGGASWARGDAGWHEQLEARAFELWYAR